MPQHPKRSALIVFGKNPVPGFVKSRLAHSIGDIPAAELYRSFLLDSLESFSSLDLDTKLFLAPSHADVDPDVRAASPHCFIQSGADLGERMFNAFGTCFEAGYRRVGIVGSDHPSLPGEFLIRGFQEVGNGNIVLGPSFDGGYYFLALDRPRPELFSNILYGKPTVLQTTLDRVRRLDSESKLLPPWYDIDTIDDLERLAKDLRADSTLCPKTRETMKRLQMI